MILKIFFPVFLYFGFIAVIYAGSFKVSYRSGLQKLNSRDYAAALSKFKEAYDYAELSTEEVKVLLIIANVYFKQKKYKDAKNWVAKILDIPDLKLESKVITYRSMISYSKCLKRYADALDDVRMALRIVNNDKDKAFFFIERAKIFEVQKKYSRAVDALRDCIEICESGSLQWQAAQQRLIIVLFKQKKYKEVLELLPELQLDKWQTFSRQLVYYYAGLCGTRQGDYKLAASWFERMPDKGRSWLVYSKNVQLGACWKKMTKYENAYKCFEIIYKNKKLQKYYRANGLWMMADLCYLQKKYKDSKLLCERLKKFPKASKNQIKRANSLIKKANQHIERIKK